MPSPHEPLVIIGGGQSGLATARAALDASLVPLVLEAGDSPSGSWPRYYDSLRVFSPARFSSFPGMPFPGDPDRYPTGREVADYLRSYAASLDVEIRTNTRVDAVEADGAGFTVRTAAGDEIRAAGVVAATGTFSRPHVPEVSGASGFTGEVLHVADYRVPEPYRGRRIVVVGGGNSAVQVGYELAQIAQVTLATLEPLLFIDQRPGGRDLHHLLESTGFDDLPPEWLAGLISGVPVLDTGEFRAALESGVMDRRPMFTTFTGDGVVWSDGEHEPVDVVVFATGYRPSLDYLRPLGALDPHGSPLHTGGISTTHLGLAYVGLEFQRSFSSNTLRGVHRDAEHVVGALAAHLRGAVTAIGL
jgi:putative flavoprotein involved in K+ transport